LGSTTHNKAKGGGQQAFGYHKAKKSLNAFEQAICAVQKPIIVG
jgi:hypothetical protein